ncbi:uncharacterized protein [Palaemon carinicauda]|uniref:uncharacterized protein n=1 Tax=Palaemon carinicauda TaxID=392227 RepID=UPI0035B6232F
MMDSCENDPTSPGYADSPPALLTTSGNSFKENSVDDVGTKKDYSLNTQKKGNLGNTGKLNVLHITQIPLETNYDMLHKIFECYGLIKEIRMKLQDDNWESWLSFNCHEEAFNASRNIVDIKVGNMSVKGALCDGAPKDLDVYRPADWADKDIEADMPSQRKPKPPMWLLAQSVGGTENYFKVCKFLQRKVGTIAPGDISRFGKKSYLIKAKSYTQSVILSNLKTVNDDIKLDIKPHLNFSYGRGVVFNRDLYEFIEEEILTMCPLSVWKVHKVPGTSMIVLTFQDADVPSHIDIENERIRVQPFKQKPLQCYNCFKFGHPSKVCNSERICNTCFNIYHGECTFEARCLNCNSNHKSNDRSCQFYKLEEAALNKSIIEHVSVGHAKRLLNKSNTYAKTLKTGEKVPRESSRPPTTVGSSRKRNSPSID